MAIRLRALALCVLSAAILEPRVATPALAAPGALSAPSTPSPEILRTLAIEALRHEKELLPLAGPDRLGTPAGDAALRRLVAVDTDGDRLFRQLLLAGLRPSPTLARALRRLPFPRPGGPPPGGQEYDVAIQELRDWTPGGGEGLPIPRPPNPVAADRPEDPRRDGAPLPASLPVPRQPVDPADDDTRQRVITTATTLVVGGLVALAVIGLARTLRRSGGGRDELARLALTDTLTGTANRVRLDLDRQALAAGPPTRLSLLMIDVDHFKQVNDRFGHPAGDDVLRRVARVLNAQVRPDDVVYRYGGEEFCALLRNASYAESRRVAERLCAAVALAPMSIGEKVTVSIGLASGMSPQIELILRRADAALYDAKRSGRNRVVADEGAFPSPLPTSPGVR